MRNIVFAALAMSALACQASEIDFSYNTTDSPAKWYGYDKAETYDVAILIDNQSLVGSSITGLQVALPGGEKIESPSGWLSSELILKKVNGKNVNTPDICTKNGAISDDILTVTFDSPYIIEGPVYVGYSFKVTDIDGFTGKPVAVAEGDAAGGLFLHSSSTKLKWGDMVNQAGGVSCVKVMVEGDFSDNAAVFVANGVTSAAVDYEEIKISASVVNQGVNAISSVEYTWSFEGNEGSGIITPDTPIPAIWGASIPVELTVPAIDVSGSYETVVNVVKVNGEPNAAEKTDTSLPVRVYPFIPVNRPLVEEYTGLWCGGCPSGYVAFETLHKQNPDTFIGLAYHEGDAMAFDSEDWPAYPGSYPTVYINRSNKMGPPELYKAWPNYASATAVAAIDVEVEWANDEETEIRATSKVCFVEDYDNADFAISYALVADGLSDPSWHQSNAYAGTYVEGEEDPEMPGEFGEIFTKGPNPVDGLVFNDVALTLLKPNGFDGSVPKKITLFEEYKHTCKISLDDLHRKLKDLAKNNRDGLRVVAILIDRKTERAVNCNTSLHMTSSGIDEICEESVQAVKTVWHNLQGCQVSEPKDGLYIRTDIMPNGMTKSEKIFVK